MLPKQLLGMVLAANAWFGGSVAAEVKIVDGDTLDLNGTRFRLYGIDAPEFGQNCGSWDCGSAAIDALQDIIRSKAVRCESLGNDGYGRTIATCTANGQDIGASMVLGGFAWAFINYSDAYEEEEALARAMGIGVWRGTFLTPWEYRAQRWNAAMQVAPDGCPIKGNISKNGHIYHAPWSPWYERTRVDVDKGERWFCSEAEAVEAGWRAPAWR